jgi:hypothetical protein
VLENGGNFTQVFCFQLPNNPQRDYGYIRFFKKLYYFTNT